MRERSRDAERFSGQKRKSNQSSKDKWSGDPVAKEKWQRAQYELYNGQSTQKTDNNFLNNVQYESDGEVPASAK